MKHQHMLVATLEALQGVQRALWKLSGVLWVRSEETALLGGPQIQVLDDDQSRSLCLAHLFSALSQVDESQQGTYVLRTVGSNKFCSGMGQLCSMFWGTW